MAERVRGRTEGVVSGRTDMDVAADAAAALRCSVASAPRTLIEFTQAPAPACIINRPSNHAHESPSLHGQILPDNIEITASSQGLEEEAAAAGAHVKTSSQREDRRTPRVALPSDSEKASPGPRTRMCVGDHQCRKLWRMLWLVGIRAGIRSRSCLHHLRIPVHTSPPPADGPPSSPIKSCVRHTADGPPSSPIKSCVRHTLRRHVVSMPQCRLRHARDEQQ